MPLGITIKPDNNKNSEHVPVSNLVGVILGNEGSPLVPTVKGSTCKHNHDTNQLEGIRLKAADGGESH